MGRLFTLLAFALACCSQLAAQEAKSDGGPDALKGAARSVRVERTTEGGKTSESPRRWSSLTEYDERGNVVVRTTFDHRGAIQSRQVHSRDEQGNPVTTLYGRDGKLVSRHVSQADGPDGAGRFALAVHGPSGETTKHSIRRRVIDGRLAEQDVYDERGALTQRNVYTYDAAGRQVETAYYTPDGRLREKNVWPAGGGSHSVRYNDDGSVFLEHRSEPPVVEERDGHGNWTRRSERVSSTLNGRAREYAQITYRTIEYHPAKKQ